MKLINKYLLLIIFLTPLTASAGMVAFFDKPDGICPEGWRPIDNAKGRLIRGTTDPKRVGLSAGTPMHNKTPPTHKHELHIWFNPVSKSVVALEKFGFLQQNTGVAKANSNWYEKSGHFTSISDGNIPYIQMLACEENQNGMTADNMRQEMVAFFNNDTCPVNWEVYQKLNNRYVVPAPDNTESGLYNQPFGTGDATHNHKISMKEGLAGPNQVGIRLNEIGMEASEKGVLIKESDDWAKNQSPVGAISTKSSANNIVPYLELLPCRKNRGRGNIDRLSEGLMAFMSALACPTGWREKSSTHGRYLVGLPADQHAKNGTAFGGNPLESGEIRTHHHEVRHTFNWPSQPFVGYTGDTNKGFAASGDYDLIGATQEASLNLPYVQMRHCIAPARNKDVPTGIRQ